MNKDVAEVFKKHDMVEARYWQLVAMANWPNLGYDKPKREYLEQLTPEEGKKFRKVTDSLWNVLDKFIGDRNPAQGGDDAHSDFCYHIIGLGKQEFYANLENYALMESRGDRFDYKESFGYAIPYIVEWDDIAGTLEEMGEQTDEDEDESDVIRISDVIDNIAECLINADGDFIAEIYNKVCSDKIEYKGNDEWKTKETV